MTDRPTLRKGSRRPEATTDLLQLLERRGYRVDVRCTPNRVGQSIVNAVKRFQAQNLRTDGRPLAVDGVVGPETWAALLREPADAQRLALGSLSGMPRNPITSGGLHAALIDAALAHYDARVSERPMGSNRVAVLEARAQGKPWCSFWVHDRIRAVTGAWIFGGRRGSTRMDLKMAAARDMLCDPRPSDVFLLCDQAGRPYHTGFVLRVDGETMQTVEGNCANRVAIRERAITEQVVFWCPLPGACEWQRGLLPNVKRAGGESTR